MRQCLDHGWSRADIATMLRCARGTVVALAKGQRIDRVESRVIGTLRDAGVDVECCDAVADALLAALVDDTALTLPPLAAAEDRDGTRYHVPRAGVYADGTIAVRRTRRTMALVPALMRVVGDALVELDGHTAEVPPRILAELAEQLERAGVMQALHRATSADRVSCSG